MRNKKVVVDVHPICGLSTVIASVILVTLGLITLITRKCCKIDWQTHSLLSLGRVHRYMAYATLILAQVSITVGIVWYYQRLKQLHWGIIYAAINLGAFTTPIVFCEILRIRTLQQCDSFNIMQTSIDQQEFEEMIEEGRKLVILDELVIDVESFISRHPGGRFALQHNIGRDISKYFHGGYSLEGNLGPNPVQGHKHSNYARKIVNQLAIATFEKQTTVQETVMNVMRPLTHRLTGDTCIIHLQSQDKQVVPNMKHFYSGLSILGKHFTIRSNERESVTRQYTVSNIMRPKIYEELIRVLRTDDKNMTKLFSLIESDDKNNMMFVVKDYE
jgi:cytochrome b involved in lipid metabolism